MDNLNDKQINIANLYEQEIILRASNTSPIGLPKNPIDKFRLYVKGSVYGLYVYDAVNKLWRFLTPFGIGAESSGSPSNPSGTTSTTGVMMGLNQLITPLITGKVMVIISGCMKNTTNTDGTQTQIRYGTGTAPTNGASLTGTTAGGLVHYDNPAGLTIHVPVTVQAIVSGLTIGTPYWFDLSLASITGGTSNIESLSVSIIEI